jgi:hypothetical protein
MRGQDSYMLEQVLEMTDQPITSLSVPSKNGNYTVMVVYNYYRGTEVTGRDTKLE